MRARFKKCPRCNCHGLEELRTYAHCVNCFYINDPILEKRPPLHYLVNEHKTLDFVEFQLAKL